MVRGWLGRSVWPTNRGTGPLEVVPSGPCGLGGLFVPRGGLRGRCAVAPLFAQDVRDNRGMTTLESVHRASVCRCGCCGVGGGGGEEQVHHVGRRSPPPNLAELASGETENAVLIASLTAGHRFELLRRSNRSRPARLPCRVFGLLLIPCPGDARCRPRDVYAQRALLVEYAAEE